MDRVRVDETTSLEWTQAAIASRVDHRLLLLIEDPGAGSPFDTLDRLYPFEKASDRARAYLSAALEHSLFWADYTAPLDFKEGETRGFALRPTYTLARAAIEGAAQAIWLMGSTDPYECLRRHLSLIRWDLQEHRKSKPQTAAKEAVQEREQELLDRVAANFSPDRIRPPNGYLYLIKSACRASDLNLDENHAERLWRAASGATHGKYWPTPELQHVQVGDEYEPGHFRARTTPDPEELTAVVKAAGTMTRYGVLRFADYSGMAIGDLLRQAQEWVFERIPKRSG